MIDIFHTALCIITPKEGNVCSIHGKGEQKWQQRDISSPSTPYPMHMTPSMITVVEFKVKQATSSA